MTRFTRIVLAVAACSLAVSVAVGQAPPAKPEAKIEFRWLESSPDKDLTEEKGIQTTCGEQLSYPHKKPVLTNADVAAAVSKNHGSIMGLPGVHFTVTFTLTDQARKTLVTSSGGTKVKELAMFVDGKYWGTAIFRKATPNDFIPQAGFINSKAEAERIVEAVK